MINKMNVCMASIVLLTASALCQSKDSRISDDYAKAALRAVIYTNESGTADRMSFFVDEADVEASTPAEEANLKELSRILRIWIGRPSYDNQACYQALKINLKARNGAIPEACK
ncbi:MAG: hypothetical protein ABSA54_12875 [Terriglobales bacterium]